MDMLQFFQTVIPSDGVKFLAEFVPLESHPRGGVFVHHPFVDFEGMVDKVMEIDRRGRTTIYHACASYKEVIYKTSPNGREYPAGREQRNVKSVKALWQDFDVGKYEKDGSLKPISYATREDAIAALKALMKAVGLPRPLLVNSGNGFHAYWPFEKSVSPEDWTRLAAKVRATYNHLGIKYDTSRDTDLASILRPPGSHNKGREVTVLRELEPKPFEFYDTLFTTFTASNGLFVTQVAAPLENEFGSVEKIDFPPSSLVRIASHCKQVEEFRDTGGSTEPLWYAGLGLAKHCVDGEAVAHEWSSHHEGYSPNETQLKLDQWSFGPTTCEKYRTLNASSCTGCAFQGKIKSPIQLGYDTHVEAPVVEAPKEDGTLESTEIPLWPASSGFRVTKTGVIQMMVADENGVPQPHRVAAPLFYLKERIQGDDGAFIYTVRMHVRGNQWREFELPAKYRADIRSLRSTLAAYEIVVYDDKLLGVFMNDYATNLRLHLEQVNTFKQFGWTDDYSGVLIGDKLVTKNGVSEVRVSTEVIRDPRLLKAFEVRGTKQEWIDGVNELYNRENGEPYQYTICTQFGALLVPLLGYQEWNGIPLAVTSGDTGLGKSSLAKIAMNALVNSSAVMVADATARAVIGRASAMKNLPMLFDEVTTTLKDPVELSNVLYSLSNGIAKAGMQSDGRERIPLPPFKLNATLTGNKNIMSQLAESKTNPIATQMRVFEIDLESYPILESMRKGSKLHEKHHELALHLINNVSCVCTEEYIGYVIANMGMLQEKLHHTAMVVAKSLQGNAAKERFYAYHMACTMIGGWIAKKLGYISFDLSNLKNWAHRHIVRMRHTAQEFNHSIEDKFSAMLSEVHGSLLVTKHYDTLSIRSGKSELPMLPIRGPIVGRLVIGSEQERGKFFMSVKAFDDWCRRNDLQPHQFKRELAAAGLIRKEDGVLDRKISLGRGVPTNPVAQCRCYEFTYSAVQGYIEEHVGGNVVPITAAAANPVANEHEGAVHVA